MHVHYVLGKYFGLDFFSSFKQLTSIVESRVNNAVFKIQTRGNRHCTILFEGYFRLLLTGGKYVMFYNTFHLRFPFHYGFTISIFMIPEGSAYSRLFVCLSAQILTVT